MNVATIVPQNYLHLIEKDNYFMCLGNLIGKPGMEKYTDFYMRKAREGKFVIMDNGLIENDQRPLSELVEKAHQLGASEMVMTDVFRDKDRTLAAVQNGLDQLDPHTAPRLMVVPQGKTIAEWIDCARELVRMASGFTITIGVPKVLVDIGGRDGRAVAIQQLIESCPPTIHYTFHLLGCWTTPLEVTVIDKIAKCTDRWPTIRGVDSAIAFVYARAGLKLDHADRPDSRPIDFKHTEVDERLLKHNIRLWRKAANINRWF